MRMRMRKKTERQQLRDAEKKRKDAEKKSEELKKKLQAMDAKNELRDAKLKAVREELPAGAATKPDGFRKKIRDAKAAAKTVGAQEVRAAVQPVFESLDKALNEDGLGADADLPLKDPNNTMDPNFYTPFIDHLVAQAKKEPEPAEQVEVEKIVQVQVPGPVVVDNTRINDLEQQLKTAKVDAANAVFVAESEALDAKEKLARAESERAAAEAEREHYTDECRKLSDQLGIADAVAEDGMQYQAEELAAAEVIANERLAKQDDEIYMLREEMRIAWEEQNKKDLEVGDQIQGLHGTIGEKNGMIDQLQK